jgi:hypothetical protein
MQKMRKKGYILFLSWTRVYHGYMDTDMIWQESWLISMQCKEIATAHVWSHIK